MEKCTKLGASAFWSVVTDHTKLSNNENNNNHWWRQLLVVSKEAAEQLECLTVLTLRSLDRCNNNNNLERLLRGEYNKDGHCCVLLVCRNQLSEVAAPILFALDNVNRTPGAALVGPMGVWVAEEEALFDRHFPFLPKTVLLVELDSALTLEKNFSSWSRTKL